MYVGSILGAIATLSVVVSAHGIVDNIRGGGQIWSGNNPWVDEQATPAWSADNKDYGYVWDVNHINMTCHRNATTGDQFIPVKAGSIVKLKWSGSWPHPGPYMSYMARCQGSCTKAKKKDLNFFKIAHSGLLPNPNTSSTDPYWAAYAIRDNNNTAAVQIPSNIKAGDYVLRHEIIALHAAWNLTGVQFYPQCVNLRVSGPGTLQPSGIKATKLYKQNDPGILLNIWWPVPTSYVIPGPDVAAGLEFNKPGQKMAFTA